MNTHISSRGKVYFADRLHENAAVLQPYRTLRSAIFRYWKQYSRNLPTFLAVALQIKPVDECKEIVPSVLDRNIGIGKHLLLIFTKILNLPQDVWIV